MAKVVVRVQPNASKNEVLRYLDGVLNVKIAAPPIKGKANQELIRFLSEVLGVSKSKLTIIKGLTDRTKVLSVDELTQEQVVKQIEKSSKGNKDWEME